MPWPVLLLAALALPRLGQAALYLLLALMAAGAVLVGERVHRPERPLAWYLLAAGLLMLSTGDALWVLYEDVLGLSPYPSVADAFYLLAYPFLAGGVFVLIRGRNPEGDRSSLLDSLIMTTGLGFVAIALAAPGIGDASLPLLERMLSTAYPLADLLVLGMVVRLLFTPGRRSPSFWFLVTALVLTMAADLVFAYVESSGARGLDLFTELGFLLSYLFFGLFALHPSVGAVSESAPMPEIRLNRFRIALLAAASLTAPAVIAVQGARGASLELVAAAAGSALLFLLVLARMEGVVAHLERSLAERAVLQESLEYQALHDPLTGLANRTMFADRVEQAVSRATRLSQEVCVMVVDLDNFKTMNDTFGHVAGDELLVGVAERLNRSIRSSDTAARIGGDEFAVLLEDLSEPSAAPATAERILDTLNAYFSAHDGRDFLGASIGVAIGEPDGPVDPDKMLLNADTALYRVKLQGKRGYEIFA